jgi:hypothetical protein
MMHQMIVGVDNVRTVAPQLLCDLPYGAQVRPGGFLKRPHGDSPCSRLRRNAARMSQAVDEGLMTFRLLTIRKVNGQPFQATHIEIVDKLHDSHGVQ